MNLPNQGPDELSWHLAYRTILWTRCDLPGVPERMTENWIPKILIVVPNLTPATLRLSGYENKSE